MNPKEMLRAVQCAGIMLLLAVQHGCYTFTPLDRAPQAGELIRANLTPPGAIRLSELTGEPKRSLEGAVAVVSDDALGIEVVQARSTSEFQPRFVVKDTLLLPRNDVASVEIRGFSTLRTGALLAGAGGLTGYLLYRALGGGSGGDDPPNGGGPIFSVIPLFSISVPVGR